MAIKKKNDFSLQKWLEKDWGESPVPVDEDTAALELLRICFSKLKSGERGVLAAPSFAEAEDLCCKIQMWAMAARLKFKAELLPEGLWKGNPSAEDEAPRAEVLSHALSLEAPPLFSGSVHALLADCPPPDEFRDSELRIQLNDTLRLSDLTKHLVRLGYDDESEAAAVGEFSRRGGILDVYSPGMALPVRIEFFGDTVDSIREYSPSDGRSVRSIKECRILARSGTAIAGAGEILPDFSAYVPGRFLMVYRPSACMESLLKYGEEGMLDRWTDFQKKFSQIIALPDFVEAGISGTERKRDCAGVAPGLRFSAKESSRTAAELSRSLAAEFVRSSLGQKMKIILAASSETDRIHMQEWITENKFESKITINDLAFPSGILFPEEKTVVLTVHELFSSCLQRSPTFRTRADFEKEEKQINQDQAHIADIDDGDYTVHLNYGLCRFRGIKTVETASGPIESMELEFADEFKMFVPVSQAHLLTRYVGSRGGGIHLSKPGSARWLKIRSEAGASARNLACEMLRMQAVRKASPGIAFPHDSLDQRLFEESFPFELTPGQQRSINEIKHDMEQGKPMDRLLCGDVGYGKTEVALRAAFKCVQSGRQVAVLVPTTVLAQQHFQSFQERFAEYPYIIETLSRLKTNAEKHEILHRLAAGGIDIIIGTHALLGKEVAFKDLGLVIIDEEQRFGVEHKEKLKAVRTMVDVLTMTATPIPRTLHLSMSGLRDLSVITTAPVKRLPVHTMVIQYEPALIAAAINRELSRGGQVFYLFNRVKEIEQTAEKVRSLAPNARIAIAHGQMRTNELEEVMSEFMMGNIDILVCTTIIESGIDIPNANTIIVERADGFGLAELHQLRGRVGRWNRQAYAYLLIPPSGVMTSDARKRMSVIRRYTQLGSGFKLALQDLELRGAGNIIGAEQSGYVDHIGFHLYCQLLREAADAMQGVASAKIPDSEVNLDFMVFALSAVKGKLPASIPPDYVEDQRLRLDVYRRLALMTDLKSLDDFEFELRDRFGPIPLPAVHYLKATRLKLLVWLAGWKTLSCNEGKIFLEKNGGIWRDPAGHLPHIPLIKPELRLSMLIDFMKMVLNEQTGQKEKNSNFYSGKHFHA